MENGVEQKLNEIIELLKNINSKLDYIQLAISEKEE